jgi:hypothetical protein
MPTRHWHAAVPFPALTAVVGAAAAVGAIAGLSGAQSSPALAVRSAPDYVSLGTRPS